MNFKNTAIKTTGIITNIHRGPYNDGYTYTFYVRFVADGKEYEGVLYKENTNLLALFPSEG